MASMKKAGKYNSFVVTNSSVVGVFGWMFYGLLLTFGSAFVLCLLAYNGVIQEDVYLTIVIASAITFLIYSFISVFLMAFIKNKVASTVVYSIYALLFGILLSSVFISINVKDVVYALGATSLVFGIMAIYGYFTKKDLSRFGSILTMFLIGALVMSLFNVILYFVNTETFQIVDALLSYIILAVIIGYVAVDVQSVKRAAEVGALANSLPIYLAFTLYTDFMYIFIRLLAIFSSRNN